MHKIIKKYICCVSKQNKEDICPIIKATKHRQIAQSNKDIYALLEILDKLNKVPEESSSDDLSWFSKHTQTDTEL